MSQINISSWTDLAKIGVEGSHPLSGDYLLTTNLSKSEADYYDVLFPGTNWEGDWEAGAYNEDDLVYHDEKYYIANTTTSEEPPHADWDEAEGWEPIGTSANRFTGSFDGNNKIISNLFINRSSDYQGLFGAVENTAIENFNLLDVNLLSVGSYSGCVIGNASGSSLIRNINVTGNLTGSTASGKNTYGLFMGINGGSSTVYNCNSDGNIIGLSIVGGFVGYHDSTNFIYNCGFSGRVESTLSTGSGNDGSAGGFVAVSERGCVRCYSKADVYSIRHGGGFLGYTGWSTAFFNDCYSTGNVTRVWGSSTTFAGFAGRQFSAHYRRSYSLGEVIYANAENPTDKGFSASNNVGCFWNIETSNQTSSGGEAKGRTTAQMQNILCYTSDEFLETGETFEPDNYWSIENQINIPDNVSLYFNGQNYVNMGSVDYATNKISFFFKVKTKDFNSHRPLISWGDWNEDLTIYFRDDGEQISINAGIEGRDEVPYAPEDLEGEECTLIVTMDSVNGVAEVFLNGNSLGTVNCKDDGGNFPMDGDLRIGGTGAGSYFLGNIYDVRIYDKVLSSQEISDLDSGEDVTSDLIGHWKFDEWEEDTVADNIDNNDGTITGTTAWRPVWTINDINDYPRLSFEYAPPPPPPIPEETIEDSILLSDEIQLSVNLIKHYEQDEIKLSDSLQLKTTIYQQEQDIIKLSDEIELYQLHDERKEEIIKLSDEITVQPSLYKDYFEDEIKIEDEIIVKPSLIKLELYDEIKLGEDTIAEEDIEYRRAIRTDGIKIESDTYANTSVKKANGITYCNGKIYITLEDKELSVASIINNEPRWEARKDLTDLGIPNVIEANNYFNKLFIGYDNGKALKIDTNNLESQETIDLETDNNIIGISIYDEWKYTYFNTDKPEGQIIKLDESEIAKLNTNFVLCKENKRKLNSYFSSVYAKYFNSKFSFLQEKAKILHSNFVFIKEVAPTPTPRKDFEVYISGNLISDVDLASIKIESHDDEYTLANFSLARKHDESNVSLDDNVLIKLSDRELFSGKINEKQLLSEEVVHITAKTENKVNVRRNNVELIYPSSDRQLNLYEIIYQDYTEYLDKEAPLGVSVDLGTLTKQRYQRWGASTRDGRQLAFDINYGRFQPIPNVTSFWFASAELLLEGVGLRSFISAYVGTSLSGIGSDLWNLTWAAFWFQHSMPSIEYIWDGNNWIRPQPGIESVPHKLGNEPYNEVSISSGGNITVRHWQDRENGMYSVRSEGHRKYLYAMEASNIELDKIRRIDGSITQVRKNLSVDITIDSYLFYNIGIGTRIKTNVANGVSVKTLTIDASNMSVHLECDCDLHQEDLENLDKNLPDENDNRFIIPEIDVRLRPKFHIPTSQELYERLGGDDTDPLLE